MDPELRDSYLALRADPEYLVPFPPYTVGCLLVSGVRREDHFFVEDLLQFVPVVETQTVHVPLRKLRYTGPFAVYRNTRRKILILLDGGVLPLSWTNEWNEWAHLTQGSIEVTGDFWRQTRFRQREGTLEPVPWHRPATSTLTVKSAGDLARKFEQAHTFWERFRPHADKVALLRSHMEREPVDMTEAWQWCRGQGLPESIDVRLVNWHPDYEESYYRELAARAQKIYLFRKEYLFVLDRAIVAEIPQIGHASYFFRPTVSLPQFLRCYAHTTRHHIRCHAEESRKTLGYAGRLPHSRDIQTWIRKLPQSGL
jgi:hypothetical protein